jgi:hypothetical protein
LYKNLWQQTSQTRSYGRCCTKEPHGGISHLAWREADGQERDGVENEQSTTDTAQTAQHRQGDNNPHEAGDKMAHSPYDAGHDKDSLVAVDGAKAVAYEDVLCRLAYCWRILLEP